MQMNHWVGQRDNQLDKRAIMISRRIIKRRAMTTDPPSLVIQCTGMIEGWIVHCMTKSALFTYESDSRASCAWLIIAMCDSLLRSKWWGQVPWIIRRWWWRQWCIAITSRMRCSSSSSPSKLRRNHSYARARGRSHRHCTLSPPLLLLSSRVLVT